MAKLLRLYASKAVGGRTLEREGQGEAWRELSSLPLVSVEHHLAHAATAFYPSGFEEATVLTLDGEGDGYSGGFYYGDGDGQKRYAAFFHNDVTVGRDYEKVTAMLSP